MRKILVLTAALLLAGCATTPVPEPEKPQEPTPAGPTVPGTLLNLTAAELIQKMGQPVLQVREGPGLKLQFKSRSCILDAYLYPQQQGQAPVASYVDARRGDGRDVDKAACVAALRAP